MTPFAIPGDIETPTGGYGYDRGVIAASNGALVHLPLPDGFPFPSDAALEATRAALMAVDHAPLIDGLAYGALPEALVSALPYRPVALCHHPLGHEAGLPEDMARRLIETERAALDRAAHVIVTSDATKRALIADFGAPERKVTVAQPGLKRAAPAAFHREEAKGAPVILTVASLTPRKGHDVLVEALAQLREENWRAVWVGPADRDGEWAETLKRMIAEAALADRIEIAGAATEEALARYYDAAALFCLPTRYEGYGMVFAEAMMRGLPIVASDCDAAREVVPATSGAHPAVEDANALAAALRLRLSAPARRRREGAAAREAALSIPGWDETWTKIAAVLERVT